MRDVARIGGYPADPDRFAVTFAVTLHWRVYNWLFRRLSSVEQHACVQWVEPLADCSDSELDDRLFDYFTTRSPVSQAGYQLAMRIVFELMLTDYLFSVPSGLSQRQRRTIDARLGRTRG